MTLGDAFTLAPKVIPLVPRIERAIATVQKIMADPDVKDALALFAELGKIIEQSGIKS